MAAVQIARVKFHKFHVHTTENASKKYSIARSFSYGFTFTVGGEPHLELHKRYVYKERPFAVKYLFLELIDNNIGFPYSFCGLAVP